MKENISLLQFSCDPIFLDLREVLGEMLKSVCAEADIRDSSEEH